MTRRNIVEFVERLQKHMEEKGLKLSTGNSYISFGEVEKKENGVEYIKFIRDDIGTYSWMSSYEIDSTENVIYFKREFNDFRSNGSKCHLVKVIDLPEWAK